MLFAFQTATLNLRRVLKIQYSRRSKGKLNGGAFPQDLQAYRLGAVGMTVFLGFTLPVSSGDLQGVQTGGMEG
ncbi:hypothetical protein SDC9_37245 [bioreactor metagenome]|uniref:Uncharacterized protein n=1 Tax=bioreactor metagenome TaxID=1076179 RepID=A0A644VIS9_9ZZZZ